MRFLLLGILILPMTSHAFLCGSTNLFAQNAQWMRDFNKQSGLAFTLGDHEVDCGINNEDAKICRACRPNVDSQSFALVKAMFARPQFASWLDRFQSEKEKGADVSDGDFSVEQFMNHAHVGETKYEFVDRINSRWGENELFQQREILKMLRLELTVVGKPCPNVTALPTSCTDPAWPCSGAGGQAALDQILGDAQILSSPEYLSHVPLNQLGKRLSGLTAKLDELYVGSDKYSDRSYWNIRSYIDSYVGRWVEANGFSEISKDCVKRDKCYQWQGTYTAAYPY